MFDADGRQAIGAWRGQFGVLEGLEELFGVVRVDLGGNSRQGDSSGPADLPRGLRGHAGERTRQEHAHRAMRAVVHEPGEYAQFDAVRMGLDFHGFGRQFQGGARKLSFGVVGRQERKFRMGIGDGGLFQVLVHRLATTEERGLHGDVDLGAGARIAPVGLFVHQDHRLVALEVHAQLVVVGRLGFERATGDLDRFCRGDLAVHAGCRNADALLAAAHAQTVEF
jgi:hypothetical protein